MVGYVLVRHQESEFKPGGDALCIWDAALLPAYRGCGVVQRLIKQILDTAAGFGVAVEIRARESTSYQLLKHPRVVRWLLDQGYALSEEREFIGLCERFFILRFKLLEAM